MYHLCDDLATGIGRAGQIGILLAPVDYIGACYHVALLVEIDDDLDVIQD